MEFDYVTLVTIATCIISIINLKLVLDAKKKVRQLRGRK